MTRDRWSALAPLTGVLFVAIAIVGFAIGGSTPDSDDTPQKVLSFYRDHDTKEIWASAFGAWSMVVFVFFLSVLRSALRAAEGGVSRLSTAAFGGGLLLASGFLTFAGLNFTLADTADHLTPDAAQALNELNTDMFFPLAAGNGVLMLATGLSILRYGGLPGLAGWAALAIGIAGVTPAGFFAFIAFGLWSLVVSVILWRRAEAAPPAPATAATP
jgi:hypothetical protein